MNRTTLLKLSIGAILIFECFSTLSQVQMGSDITEKVALENFGSSVAMDSAGTTIVAGAYNNPGGGTSRGHLRAYKWNGLNWEQKGSDISGVDDGDAFGWVTAINNTGTIIAGSAIYHADTSFAEGHVRVFEWSGTDWSQLGDDIDGEKNGDKSGNAIALNADGTVVAIGAFENDDNGDRAGHVRVFEWTGTVWNQVGSDIDGASAEVESGKSVSLNADGSVLAVGSPADYGTFENIVGYAKVYDWKGSSWIQRGDSISGGSGKGLMGGQVDLSADGNILAVSNASDTITGLQAGYVQIYEWNGSNWVQKGSNIIGDNSNEYFGSGISMNNDGNTIVIGARNLYIGTGTVKLFSWSGTDWIQKGNDIYGDAMDDQFGFSVGANYEGDLFVAGSSVSFLSTGYVRAYSVSTNIDTMCNEYTIGNSPGTDFKSISEAINALRSAVINCDVTFNIESETYNETMDLSSLNNEDYTITFSGAGNKNTIIHPLDSIAANSSGISIVNTNNIILKKFTLEMDDISDTKVTFDSDGTRGIFVQNASNIVLDSLILSNSQFVPSESTTEYIASAISMLNGQNVSVINSSIGGAGVLINIDGFENSKIKGNYFSNGQFHIRHEQDNGTLSKGLFIDDNAFEGPFPADREASAIYMSALNGDSVSNVIIENNIIDGKNADSDEKSYSIYIKALVNPIIRNNTILNGFDGIFVRGMNQVHIESNTVVGTLNIALRIQNGYGYNVINNILASNNTACTAMFLDDLRLVNNTFDAKGNVSAIYLLGISNDSLVITNNIFSVTDSTENEIYLDFIKANNVTIDNNLYSGKASLNTVVVVYLGGPSGTNYSAATLTDWQTMQPDFDQNSQSFIPSFVGEGDYHITSGTDYRFGTFLSNITTDIDGDLRTAAGVDVGADQYFATYNEVIDTSVCNSYMFNDTLRTTSGEYVANFTSQFGNDSVVTLNLTILEPSTTTDTITACDSYTWIDGITYTESNDTATYILTNAAGCDSIITLDLTINEAYNIIEDVNLCMGSDYTFPDGTMDTNIIIDTTQVSNLTSVSGCDSIITTNITVIEPAWIVSEVELCFGENYTYPDGTIQNNITADTSQISTLVSQISGCDSIITTNITIIQPIVTLSEVEVCEGGIYIFPDGSVGVNITKDTIQYSYFNIKDSDCDSIVTTKITVIKPVFIVSEVELCQGEDYSCPDGTILFNIQKDTTYNSVLKSQISGCDSIVITNIKVTPFNTTVLVYDNYLIAEDTLAVSYQWVDCDDNNTPIAGATEFYFEVTENGNYAVLIENNGCNGISICNSVIITAIVEDETLVEKLWPNPTSGQINIQLLDHKTPFEIYIYDVMGKLLIQEEFNSNGTFFTTDLPGEKGVYFVRLTSNKKTAIYEVIKK